MDMEQKDYDSRTALHVAAAEGIWKVKIRGEADPKTFFSTKSTPIMCAHKVSEATTTVLSGWPSSVQAIGWCCREQNWEEAFPLPF